MCRLSIVGKPLLTLISSQMTRVHADLDEVTQPRRAAARHTRADGVAWSLPATTPHPHIAESSSLVATKQLMTTRVVDLSAMRSQSSLRP